MTTVYDFRLTSLRGEVMDLASFTGRPMLIVNTASKCGFTPQYAGLQTLWDTYRQRGLVVLGVPSNDFGRQEPGTAAEIAAFCEGNFRITFPLSEKRHVRGRAADPLFTWLGREAGLLGRPWWNFTKYLIGRDGKLADWFFCFTPPDTERVRRAIEKAVRA
ncbi:MAG: glutathione peroxidase [Rhodospirillaceae bacterium]